MLLDEPGAISAAAASVRDTSHDHGAQQLADQAESASGLPQSTEKFAQAALPSLSEICSAQWTTLENIPGEVRADWVQIFSECLTSLAAVFLASKALLALPPRGGRARTESLSRLLRARIREWKAGQFTELWARLVSQQAHRDLRKREQRPPPAVEGVTPQTLRRVAQLVNAGRLSQAAALLCSKGVATRTVETQAKGEALFPEGDSQSPPPPASAPTTEIDAALIRKILLSSPKATKPGPSGLRLEHLHTIVDSRKPGVEETLLVALSRLTNLAISGGLSPAIQPYLCGGRLVPLNKKDNRLRPVVVGETLRSLFAKAALAELGLLA